MAQGAKRRKVDNASGSQDDNKRTFFWFFDNDKSPAPATFGTRPLATSLLQSILNWLPNEDIIEKAAYTNSIWFRASRSWLIWSHRDLDFKMPMVRALVHHYNENTLWKTRVASLSSTDVAANSKWFTDIAPRLERLEVNGLSLARQGIVLDRDFIRTIQTTGAQTTSLQTLALPGMDFLELGFCDQVVHATVETVFLTIAKMDVWNYWLKRLGLNFPTAAPHIFVRGLCNRFGQTGHIQLCLSKTPYVDSAYQYPGDQRCPYCQLWTELPSSNNTYHDYPILAPRLQYISRCNEETKNCLFSVCLNCLKPKHSGWCAMNWIPSVLSVV